MSGFLRTPEVLKLTGLSNTTIWRMEARGDFPKRVKLGVRAVGWRVSDFEDWEKSRRPRGEGDQ